MNIPASLTAGDSWSWTATYGDYPASTWTAVAYFENATEKFNVTSSADGDDFEFSATAATTADFEPGRYFVRVRVTDGTDPVIVEEGWCDVEADPASGVKTDPRSWARRTLDAVEAFLEGNATTAQQSMSVAGRSISRYSLSELMQLRNQLRAEVRTEEQGSSAGLGRDIKVRYGRPT